MAYQLILSNFRADPVEKLKYFCIIDSCKKVVTVSRSNKSHNLKRHLQTIHKELYEKLFLNLPTHKVQRLKLIQSCVEMVTVNGRPLIALEDTGFQKSIAFQLNYLAQNGCPLTVNSRNIKPYIEQFADAVREKMKTELSNRLLSVTADIATKNHRAVLGINVQYYSEGQIILRTIGMIEMHLRHTGENIKDLITQLLDSYNISMDQIHSYTTDNAANIAASGDWLNEAAKEYNEELNIEDFEFNQEFAEIFKNLSDSLGRDFAGIQLPSITGIGCAAHILQLIIHEALKDTCEQAIINNVRDVMKELRNQVNMIEIEARGAKLPILDVLTRWNSIYLMLERALELRPIIDELSSTNVNLFLTETEWEKAAEIVKILHYPFRITQLLQNVNYTMSSFYAAWHQMKLLYEKLAPKSDLAGRLLAAMNHQKYSRILTNPLILCSVFLDPRVKSMLSKSREQSYIAKLYLAQLWDRNSQFEKRNAPTVHDDHQAGEIPLEFNFDLLTEFMNADVSNASTDDDATPSNKPDILSMLNEFESQKAEPMAKSVFEYWEEKKHIFPELYKLAKIVHAVPPAQASCERTFSTLAFVFNKLRSQLSEQMLQDTMLIKLNKDLFYVALQDDIEKNKFAECDEHATEDMNNK